MNNPKIKLRILFIIHLLLQYMHIYNPYNNMCSNICNPYNYNSIYNTKKNKSFKNEHNKRVYTNRHNLLRN